MKIPKEGSIWQEQSGITFRVITTIILDNKYWIHYINNGTTNRTREYSCYLESFLERFTEVSV